MTVNIRYPTSLNKLSVRKAKTLYKISVNKDRPILHLSLDRPQRGNQGLGKKHRIHEFYIDSENRVFAGFIAPDEDKSGLSYNYVPIGRLHVLNGEII